MSAVVRLACALLLATVSTLAAAVGASLATAPAVMVEVERAALTVTEHDLEAHLRVLASDELEGRGTGTSGNARAAEYIASALERSGVAPADGHTYFQPFTVVETKLGSGSILRFTDGRGRTTVNEQPGVEFYPADLSGQGSVEAPVVFARHGVVASGIRDDYAGINVRGRIAAVLDGTPVAGDSAQSPVAEAAELRSKIAAARDRGATGLLVIQPRLPPLDRMWPVKTSPRTTQYRLADDVAAQTMPVAFVSEVVAERIVGRVARQGQSTTKQAPRGIVTLSCDLTRHPLELRNVIAALAGSDPARRDELIVVGAHLDHDGVDDDRRIYNGADDDASGVGAVLEVAEAFAAAAAHGARPSRTLVFGLWNAEEKGLLGSRYYVVHPAPAGRPVANLNLDMVGRDEDVPDPSDPRYSGLSETHAADNKNVLHLLGYSYSPELTAAVRDANEQIHLDVRTAYDTGSHNLLRRSDQWSFLQRRVPALFLTTGLHPDYHAPSDDIGKINFEKLERIARLTFGAAWRVADASAPPQYVQP